MEFNHERSATQAWLKTLSNVLSVDETPAPAIKPELGQTGNPSRELLSYHSIVDMRYPVVAIANRKLSYQFMFAEALWILEGRNDLEGLLNYNSKYADFSDDGKILAGAYGPHIISQYEYIIKTLENDKSSRQAVMTTWRKNPKASKDIPCTLSTQFLIRDDRLHLIHTMRSSDIWLGWPYDIFSFSMVGLFIALSLRPKYSNLRPGSLFFTAGSQHLYTANHAKALQVCSMPDISHYNPLKSRDFMGPATLIEWLRAKRDREQHQITFLNDIPEIGKYHVQS